MHCFITTFSTRASNASLSFALIYYPNEPPSSSSYAITRSNPIEALAEYSTGYGLEVVLQVLRHADERVGRYGYNSAPVLFHLELTRKL